MKKITLLLIYFLILSSFYGCKKNETSLIEKLDFVNLRQTTHQTPFEIIDDSVSMKTVVKFNGQIIFDSTWEHGIYSGPIIKTRLLWARSESNLNFLIVGHDDLFYERLFVIKTNGSVGEHEIGVISLLESGLRENETRIWFKYNNSWIRTGQIPDSEIQVFL